MYEPSVLHLQHELTCMNLGDAMAMTDERCSICVAANVSCTYLEEAKVTLCLRRPDTRLTTNRSIEKRTF